MQPLALCLLLLTAGAAFARAPDLSSIEDGRSELCADETSAESPEALTEEIVPCAVLDSDHFGPHCTAARIYIHTTSGVLLCSVLLPPLDLELRDAPEFDDPPTGAAGQTGGGPLGAPADLTAELEPPPAGSVALGAARLLEDADGARAPPAAPG